VPYADPAYARLRPRLAIDRDQVVQAHAERRVPSRRSRSSCRLGRQRLAIVQGVGYPDPNLSHFRSIEIWDTASKSDEYLEAGWLRARSRRRLRRAASPPTAWWWGRRHGPLAGTGARAIALANPEQFLRNARSRAARASRATPRSAHILRVERDVLASAQRLHARSAFTTAFPRAPSATPVATAAQLAANERALRWCASTLDGFDTHANQHAPTPTCCGSWARASRRCAARWSRSAAGTRP
jgi:uncharacterized protein (DUF1501 family)